MSEFSELLAKEFSSIAKIDPSQLEALNAHYKMLANWNERLNLTRIIELADVVRLHYCESLFLARFLPAGSLRIVDVGSGAGFPGIPVAIARPELRVDLVEADQRKSVFLREATRQLKNVRVIAERVHNRYGDYDWAISRAVASVDLMKLRLAPRLAFLGTTQPDAVIAEEIPIPWGENRKLFHVKLNSIPVWKPETL